MKIVLATGIYPPEIGGPATYVRHLAAELASRGNEVVVVTYGQNADELFESEGKEGGALWKVIRVPTGGGSGVRWNRYAKALRIHGKDAEIIEAFSSVSAGIPLRLARIKGPKKILRLGGDFLWERYTDYGGKRTLRQFYASYPGVKSLLKFLIGGFDHIVFSTAFQQDLYRRLLGRKLSSHSVIENALPVSSPSLHVKHEPLRLLYLGRFVRFKNLSALLTAVAALPHARLTLVGSGPVRSQIEAFVQKLSLQSRVSVQPAVHGSQKREVFDEHDLLVLPSLTDISPNAALEARAAGLPVLITEENGLSPILREGMTVRSLRSSTEIVRSVLEIDRGYDDISRAAAEPLSERQWGSVAEDHVALFRSFADKSSAVPSRP